MWFWYSLLSAFLGSLSVIISKKALHKVSSSVLTFSLFAFPLPFLLIYLMYNHNFSINSLFYVGAISSAIVFTFAKLLSILAIKQSSLSIIYPLTALSPIFNWVLGIIFFQERISLFATIGTIIIIIGIYLFNTKESEKNFFKPFTLIFKNKIALIYIFSILLSSISAIFDKTALLNIKPFNPYFTLLAENIVTSTILYIYLQQKKKNWIGEIKNNFKILLTGSIVYALATIVFFIGFAQGPIVLTTTVSRLNIVFVLILSYLLFHDKPSKYAVLGTIIMIIGAIIIKIS